MSVIVLYWSQKTKRRNCRCLVPANSGAFVRSRPADNSVPATAETVRRSLWRWMNLKPFA